LSARFHKVRARVVLVFTDSSTLSIIKNLRYADDTMLVASIENELQELVGRLHRTA